MGKNAKSQGTQGRKEGIPRGYKDRGDREIDHRHQEDRPGSGRIDPRYDGKDGESGGEPVLSDSRGTLPQHHQPFGIGERKRLQKDAANDAGYRDRGSDPEGESQDHDRRMAGRARRARSACWISRSIRERVASNPEYTPVRPDAGFVEPHISRLDGIGKDPEALQLFPPSTERDAALDDGAGTLGWGNSRRKSVYDCRN